MHTEFVVDQFCALRRLVQASARLLAWRLGLDVEEVVEDLLHDEGAALWVQRVAEVNVPGMDGRR